MAKVNQNLCAKTKKQKIYLFIYQYIFRYEGINKNEI